MGKGPKQPWRRIALTLKPATKLHSSLIDATCARAFQAARRRPRSGLVRFGHPEPKARLAPADMVYRLRYGTIAGHLGPGRLGRKTFRRSSSRPFANWAFRSRYTKFRSVSSRRMAV